MIGKCMTARPSDAMLSEQSGASDTVMQWYTGDPRGAGGR